MDRKSDSIDSTWFLEHCKKLYSEGITPLDEEFRASAKFNAFLIRTNELIITNGPESFSHFLMTGHYFVQLWAAHFLIDVDGLDERIKKLCLDEIVKYSKSEINGKVATEELKWIQNRK